MVPDTKKRLLTEHTELFTVITLITQIIQNEGPRITRIKRIFKSLIRDLRG